jgi:hypothetical protein
MLKRKRLTRTAQPSGCVPSPPAHTVPDVDADQARYLGRAAGYVDHPVRGLRGEPQALTADEQDQVTRQAAQVARDRDRETWVEARTDLQRRIDWLYSQRFARDVHVQLAALQRQLDRLDARLSR